MVNPPPSADEDISDGANAASSAVESYAESGWSEAKDLLGRRDVILL